VIQHVPELVGAFEPTTARKPGSGLNAVRLSLWQGIFFLIAPPFPGFGEVFY
jgi:hypothetical protein